MLRRRQNLQSELIGLITYHLFSTVRIPWILNQRNSDISLDERPFDHTFFLRIAQAFPFLKDLTVKNFQAQNRNVNDDNRHFSMIEYPSLTTLCLKEVHDDYAEQFLRDDKTFFLDYIWLMIDYETLRRVTQNFTRDATRLNCMKIKVIHLSNRLDLPNHFYTYFPSLKK